MIINFKISLSNKNNKFILNKHKKSYNICLKLNNILNPNPKKLNHLNNKIYNLINNQLSFKIVIILLLNKNKSY
jgi:hypothetical protein